MKLAVQLYTLRDLTKTVPEFRDALRRVADLGYPGVQLSAVGCMEGERPALDAAGARALLDEAGLVCCATHRAWGRLVEQPEEEIAFHRTLGCDYTAIGGAGNYANTPAGYRELLADGREMVATLKAAGIRFGYHNHSHEFARTPEGRGYDVLLDEGGPDWQLEIDTYWVAHAGIAPEKLLARAPGRIAAIHAKDLEVVDGKPTMAPVGEGNLDWTAILATARAGGTEWVIVEQDVCRRDPFDCLASSHAYLTRRLADGEDYSRSLRSRRSTSK